MTKRSENDRAAKLKALHAALDEGENSGRFEPFDFNKFVERTRKRESGTKKAAPQR